MKLTIELNLDNSAFEIDPEGTAVSALAIADVLQKLVDQFKHQDVFFDVDLRQQRASIRDVNGNTCGHWQIV
ncbi:MAG: hypothetical protein ACK5X3_17450 [Pseudomonadota bacterium]|jgi:hypothetical protein